MRVFAQSLFLAAVLANPVLAQGLPKALEARMVQGVQACLNFYERRESITALASKGFSQQRRWMEVKVDLSAETPRKRPYFVRVLIENKTECEIHSDYLRDNAERLAFDLAKSVVAKGGFVTVRDASFASRSKSVFQKGQVSMWFKVRNRSNKLMVKFRERPITN